MVSFSHIGEHVLVLRVPPLSLWGKGRRKDSDIEWALYVNRPTGYNSDMRWGHDAHLTDKTKSQKLKITKLSLTQQQ